MSVARTRGAGAAAVGSALIDRIEASIREARDRSELDPVTVVTPTLFSAYFMRQELAARGRGLFNVTFLRLDDLAERLLPQDDGRPALSRLHAAEIVYGVAGGARTGTVLDRLSTHRSLHAALHRTFDDLRYAGAEVVDAISGRGDVPRGVIGLWRLFLRGSANYRDRLDVAHAAAGVIRAGPDVLAARFGQIVVPLIEEPPPQYMPLLEALLEQPGVEVIAGVTGDADADRRVRELAGLDGAAQVDAAKPVDARLVTVADRNEEVRWVVRNVLELARSGVRFGRIAVLYGDSTYGPRIDEALKIAGLPVSGPEPSTLAASPEGRFVTGLLGAARELSRDAVMAWLTGTPVRSRDDGVALHASRWDRISRSAGVTKGIDAWRSRLTAHGARLEARAEAGDRPGDADAATVAGMRTEAREVRDLLVFVERLSGEASPPGDGTWSSLGSWLTGLVDLYLESGGDRDAGERAGRVREVLERLQALDELGGEAPGLDRFEAVLQDELEQPVGSTRRLGMGVFVAPVRDAVGTWFEAVHIVGMSEGSFPSAVVEDPLLPDALREEVDPVGGSLLTRAARRASARRQYLTALGAAPLRYLLWPRSESGGRRGGLPARWFVEEARRLDGEESSLQAGEIARLEREWIEHVPSYEGALTGNSMPGDGHEYALRSVMLWHDPGRPAGEHFLARDASGAYRRALRLQAGRFSPRWTRWDGNLVQNAPVAPEGGEQPISPTRLETWARCPFQYFLTYVLGLEAVERPEELLSLSALEKGSLVHRILERFVKALGNRELSQQDEERLIGDVAQEEFASVEALGITGKPALWRIDRRRIERELAEFVRRNRERRREKGQRTIATEFRFGLAVRSEPAVEVELPGIGVVRFSGVIDRVDASDDGGSATVIDYKTGGSAAYSRIRDDPLDRGMRLQLPVYAEAARRHLGGRKGLDSLYWFVSERGGWNEVHQPLTVSDEEVRETAGRIVSGVRGGVFPAHPGDPRASSDSGGSNCTFCPFSERICPRGRLRLWELKRKSGPLSSYLTLTAEEA